MSDINSTYKLPVLNKLIFPPFLFLLVSQLISCATFVGEEHYFQAVDKETGNVTNYYRLSVDGSAFMSSARYVSGYYDERAVDLFFNEMKISTTKPTDTTSSMLFNAEANNPGTQNKITPLSPTDENGAFLMVLSSNASSVTNTIGQFAENQIVADAITNLANRDVIIAEEKKSQADMLSANATSTEINNLFDLVPSSNQPDKSETIAAYIRILNAIARGLDEDQSGFTDFNNAETWLKRMKQGRR